MTGRKQGRVGALFLPPTPDLGRVQGPSTAPSPPAEPALAALGPAWPHARPPLRPPDAGAGQQAQIPQWQPGCECIFRSFRFFGK